MTPATRPPDIANLEGHEGYDVRWAWNDGPLETGLTCVFRVKDEARNLPWVLPGILAAVQHVVVVDNGSSDGTLDVAARVAAEQDASDRVTLLEYPFRVSRAGTENLSTRADSVHSLTHFYNWSFGHVRTSYSMKWDGDMVLTEEGVRTLADLAWQLEGSGAVALVPRHSMTVVSDSEAWIDLGVDFREPWIYPMGPEYVHKKAFEWELRVFPEDTERIHLPPGMCVELKWLDADEFAHWSSTAFSEVRIPRKRREWQVDRAIREGRPESVFGLRHITAPPGVHVVDHVVRDWLPRAPRPLVTRDPAAEPDAV
ncbi:hypothetical protein [uncultured Nocardioides sp.]|uniref:glycosyltransferase family 2 protein n=1 Tax=uncultured Nocardioides sp. TaxID=198441 RepID=UPI0026104F67|nr:hypothetical protein [uncultured Nocardioides sp.]